MAVVGTTAKLRRRLRPLKPPSFVRPSVTDFYVRLASAFAVLVFVCPQYVRPRRRRRPSTFLLSLQPPRLLPPRRRHKT